MDIEHENAHANKVLGRIQYCIRNIMELEIEKDLGAGASHFFDEARTLFRKSCSPILKIPTSFFSKLTNRLAIALSSTSNATQILSFGRIVASISRYHSSEKCE